MVPLTGAAQWGVGKRQRDEAQHTAQNDGPRRGERDGCPRGGTTPTKTTNDAKRRRRRRGTSQGPAGAAAPHALERAHDEGQLLQFGAPTAAGVEGRSLQDAFKRRKERRRTKQARARGRAGATGRGAPRKDPTANGLPGSSSSARHYIGTPYAERYHKPGDPLYASPCTSTAAI